MAENTADLKVLQDKLDQALLQLEDFSRKQELVQDLLKDMNLIGNSALFSLQEEMELENVSVEGRDLKEMLLLLMKNIQNINNILRQMDAMTDLGQETGYIMRSLVMDFTQKTEQLEQKGYFQLSRQALSALDSYVQHLPAQTMQNLQQAAPQLADLTGQLADPGLLARGSRLLKMRGLLVPGLCLAWAIPVALLLLNLFV